MCGESKKLLCIMCALLGSPPRVRGKSNYGVTIRPEDRITPACAGKVLKISHKISVFVNNIIRFHLTF